MLVILVLLSVTLVTVDYGSGSASGLGGAGKVVSDVLGPIERVTAAILRPIGGALAAIWHLPSTSTRIRNLTDENAKLREELALASRSTATAGEVGRLLGVAGNGGYKIIPAQVIAIGSSVGFDWTVTVDAGSSDGITTDMTVISGDGLVGRVVSVTPWTSTVLLTIDPVTHIVVRVVQTGQLGELSGNGQGPLDLSLLSTTARLKAGEQIVTWGLTPGGRPYVAGVPIGTVSQVLHTPGAVTAAGLVTPSVDPTSIDLVGIVIAPPRTAPRGWILPAPVATTAPSTRPSRTPSHPVISPSAAPTTTPPAPTTSPAPVPSVSFSPAPGG